MDPSSSDAVKRAIIDLDVSYFGIIIIMLIYLSLRVTINIFINKFHSEIMVYHFYVRNSFFINEFKISNRRTDLIVSSSIINLNRK